MMMTQNGKLLYISDNAAEYLGHSMVSELKLRKNQNEIKIERKKESNPLIRFSVKQLYFNEIAWKSKIKIGTNILRFFTV